MKNTLLTPIRVCVLAAGVVSVSAVAQSVASPRVTPVEQVNRDSVRQRLLDHELRTESAAVLKAEQRQRERLQAGDAQGASDAASALRQHAINILALRREITLSMGTNPVARRTASLPTSPTVTPKLSPVAAPREAVQPDGGFFRPAASPPAIAVVKVAESARTWDMYRNKPVVANSSTGVGVNTDVVSTIAASDGVGTSASWGMYGNTTRTVAAATGKGRGTPPRPVDRVDLVPRSAPVEPYLVYRDPSVAPKINGSRSKDVDEVIRMEP